MKCVTGSISFCCSNRRLLTKARELLGAGRTKPALNPRKNTKTSKNNLKLGFAHGVGELLFVRRLSPLSRQPP